MKRLLTIILFIPAMALADTYISNASLPVTQSGTWTISTGGGATSSGNVYTDGGFVGVLAPDGGNVNTNVMNFPASQAVTGTFYQATQPVSTLNADGGYNNANVMNFPAVQPTSQFYTSASATLFSCSVTGTSEGLCENAPGAGLSYYVTSICISNSSTAQTIALRSQCDAGSPVTEFQIQAAASGGACVSLPVPIEFGSNANLCCDPQGAVSATCNVVGYTAAH